MNAGIVHRVADHSGVSLDRATRRMRACVSRLTMARAGLTGAAEDPQWVRGAKDSDLRTKKRRPEKIGRNAPSKTRPPLNVHVPKPQFVPHTMFSRFRCKRFVNQLTYTVLIYCECRRGPHQP